jgi:DNA polymerase III subunit delta
VSAPAPLKPAYLIVGTDRPKVRRALDRLRERVIAESGSDINVSVFQVDGDRPARAFSALMEATRTPGFALGTRLLLVRDVHLLRAKQRRELAGHVGDPSPETCLALEAEKLGKEDVLYKAVAKAGTVLTYDLPRKNEMAGWVRERAAAKRLPMSISVARHLLEVCGQDPRHSERLEREIEKLAQYCNGDEAFAHDVDAVCTPDDEARIFRLMDAVGGRERVRAFVLLEMVYVAGEDPNAVLYSLLRHVRNLEKASREASRPGGADQYAAAKRIGVPPFMARKLLEQSEHYDQRRFGRAYKALAAAEAGLRGRPPATLERVAGVDHGDRLVVELALAQLLS